MAKAPTTFVKNGVTSTKHDRWMAHKQADAKRRRAEEAKKFEIAAKSPHEARIRQESLGGQKHPCAVLGIRHPKDFEVMDWMVCEITQQATPDGKDVDLMLMMSCPRCIRSYNRPPDDCIMHIRQSNRMWHLDQRTKETRQPNPILHTCAGELWVNPEDKSEVIIVAGMVTTDDWCKCPICSWEFKIDDSIVYTRN